MNKLRRPARRNVSTPPFFNASPIKDEYPQKEFPSPELEFKRALDDFRDRAVLELHASFRASFEANVKNDGDTWE